jgi:aminoglycoside phosphotransferase (APT) family kinase protein
MPAGPGVAFSLEPGTIGRYLVERGLLPDADVTVEALSGGVSNDVLAVGAGGVELVVKQALPRLRVADEWLATPNRIEREAQALSVAGALTPGAVPEPVHLARDLHLLVMTRAAPGARTWKADLLGGRVDAAVAASLGALAGRWHAATADDPATAGTFVDLEAFVQLRVDPYHRTVASRTPGLAARIEDLAGELLAPERRCCLVHGDLSPKNVLVDAPGLWVIDWEVAHFGNPVFDLGFVLCHLACKAVHRPAGATSLATAAATFLDAYAHVAPELRCRTGDAELAAHTAALMLARADGKSPVEYLDEEGRERLRDLAGQVLRATRPGVEDLFGA